MKANSFVPAIVAVAVLAGCDSGGSGVQVFDSRPEASRPASSEQVDVFRDNIAAARATPQSLPVGTDNLFTNGGFESGLNYWTACAVGSIAESTDAYRGDAAMQLNAGNCAYRTVAVEPGESYALSCFLKLTTKRAWTGMGMVFADESYRALNHAPVAVATSGSYMRLDTRGTAPADASSLNMWVHSDHGAVVDSCSLTLLGNQSPRPAPTAQNLISNGSFLETDDLGGAADWTAGCHGTVINDGSGLFLSDGACVDQALSAETIGAIENRAVNYSCLIAEVEGYSDLSVFLDGELQGFQRINASHKNQRVELAVDALQPENGFVSLYSEGHLRVENCQLVLDGVAVTDTPEDTTEDTNTGAVPETGVDPVTDTTPDTNGEAAADADADNGTDTSTDTTPATATDTGTGTDTDAAPVVQGSARYRITFNATWSSATHPVNYPPPAHFSGLVGAVHNSDVAFWGPGQQATDGIQLMAETGNGSVLLSEVADAISNGSAAAQIAGGGVDPSPGTVSVEFEVTTEHPLLTVTSMVAPSPDWFVGVHGLSLFDGTNFVDNVVRDLAVYDAGTDSGVTFTSADTATLPQAPISLLTSAATDTDLQNGLPSIGQFVIEKLSDTISGSETTDNTSTTDASADNVPVDAPVETSARYRLTFDATWSAATHPVNYPPPAHFSGLVGAVHSNEVDFWAPGQQATAGIQLMAETGNGSVLLQEVAAAVSNGSAAAEIAGGGVDDTPGSVSVEFEVTVEHPLVTVTSMVAPSPDWFVGVHGLSLFDGTGFVDTLVHDLRVYDSGTDSGVIFTSADQVTQPQVPISLLNSAAGDTDFTNGQPFVGRFIFEKLP